MKRFVFPLLGAIALAGAVPAFAATKADCKRDIAEFDAAVKTTTTSPANVSRAMKLRNEGAKDCIEKGGTPRGDSDLDGALALIGVRK
jgi:hypothetical protein